MLFAHVKADYCFGVTLAIRKPTSPTLIGASIIATFMVLFFRAAGTWGKLRGDESLLISDAVRHGFVAIPDLFGGYLHVAQRTVVTLVSVLPVSAFPSGLMVAALCFWTFNLFLMALATSRASERSYIWIALPLLACLPVLGIEIMGDVVHIQVAMFVGIAAVIVLDQLPKNHRLLHLFGVYVLVFGLSSPSIVLISLALFYRHERPRLGQRESEHRHQLVLRYAVVGLLLQLWATAAQDERGLYISFDNFLTGIRFMVFSVLPQPYRDMYFDTSATAPGVMNTVFQFVIFALIVAIIYRLKDQRDHNHERLFMELLGFGVVATVFYTTISDSYHTGYLAALHIFGGVAAVHFFIHSTSKLKLVAAVGLVVLAVGSVQSFQPNQIDDVFFGGGGWLYSELAPWDEALERSRVACAVDPSRDVFIATNLVDSYWGVVLSCKDLR